MKKTRLNALLIIGIIGSFTCGGNLAVQLFRAFGENQDIWWTARTMPLTIDETEESFELSISGKTIQKHVSEGTLLAADTEGNQRPVVSGDISVRLNNWNKVRASILTNALYSAVLFGASITMLIVGLIPVLNKRNYS